MQYHACIEITNGNNGVEKIVVAGGFNENSVHIITSKVASQWFDLLACDL